MMSREGLSAWPVTMSARWIRPWVARNAALVTAAGHRDGRHARAARPSPATRNAAPISCTKCGLNGPVWETPGIVAYQLDPASSIHKPFATLNRAVKAARVRRMATSCALDEREPCGVTAKTKNLVGRERTQGAKKPAEKSPWQAGPEPLNSRLPGVPALSARSCALSENA